MKESIGIAAGAILFVAVISYSFAAVAAGSNDAMTASGVAPQGVQIGAVAGCEANWLREGESKDKEKEGESCSKKKKCCGK